MLVYWLFFFLSLNRAQRNLCGKDSGRFGSIWFAQMSSKWGMKSSFSFFFHFFWFRLNRAVAAHSVRRFSRIFAGCVVHLRCLKITSYCTCSQDRSRLAVSTLGARSKTFVACRLYFVKDRLKVIFLSWRKSARREGRKSGFLFVFVSKWCFLGENEASALFYVLKNWDLGRAWIPWTPACRWSPALAAKCVKVGWCLVLSAWRLSGRKRADMHISRRRDLNCQLICSVVSVKLEWWVARLKNEELQSPASASTDLSITIEHVSSIRYIALLRSFLRLALLFTDARRADQIWSAAKLTGASSITTTSEQNRRKIKEYRAQCVPFWDQRRWACAASLK